MKGYMTSFMGALSPILTLSRCLGVFALDKEFNFSRILYIYCILVGMGCLIGKTLRFFWIASTKKISIFLLSSMVVSQLSLLLCWLAFYIRAPKSQPLKEALLRLADSLPGRESFAYPWKCYSVLGVKLIRSLLLIVTRRLTLMRLFFVVDNFICQSAVDALLVQFAAITDLTFQIINHYYQKLDSLPFEENEELLDRMYAVCCLYRSVNAYFTPLILMGFCTFYVTLPPVSFLAAANVNFNRHLCFVLVTEIMSSFYVVFVIVSSCNSLRRKVDAFNKKIYEMTRLNDDALMKDRVKLFVTYQPKIKPKCVTFYIDNPVIVQLIATCMTYVVILIQYGNTKTIQVSPSE